jgi:hypothetical protein
MGTTLTKENIEITSDGIILRLFSHDNQKYFSMRTFKVGDKFSVNFVTSVSKKNLLTQKCIIKNEEHSYKFKIELGKCDYEVIHHKNKYIIHFQKELDNDLYFKSLEMMKKDE